MSDYERAAALIAESKDDADFAGPRPAELIQAAEEALGVQFPPTYRRFVSEYGAGNIGSTEIYGVIDFDFEASSIPMRSGTTSPCGAKVLAAAFSRSMRSVTDRSSVSTPHALRPMVRCR